MSDNLRDRIAATLYCHRYPREPMWGALAMARGEGMATERGQTNCVQRIYVPMAQAIIDEFGMQVEERLTEFGIDDPGYQQRVVGKWEEAEEQEPRP